MIGVVKRLESEKGKILLKKGKVRRGKKGGGRERRGGERGEVLGQF